MPETDRKEIARITEEKAERVLAFAYNGIHHVEGWSRRKKYHPFGLSVNVLAQISTFDGDQLTRLVIAAHYECIRLEVKAGGPNRLKLFFSYRMGREGNFYDRHPTIEQALETYRAELSPASVPA